MPTYPLTRSSTPLVSMVPDDPITLEAIRPFDLDVAEPKAFFPFEVPAALPADWGVGMIVGASGSGKSQLLSRFAEPVAPVWDNNRSICSHFTSAEDATDRFYAVGLNTVPVWRKAYRELSNGQQFRADLARVIGTGATIDEFTSVVDRNVAMSASRAMSSYIARTGVRRVVLAGVHRDVIDWVNPDWVIDTDAGILTVGSVEARPSWYGEWVRGDGPVGRLELA